MSSPAVQAILDAIRNLKVSELSELIDELPGFAVLAGFVPGQKKDDSQTLYDMYLCGVVKDKMIHTIKEVRRVTGWGLKESKDAADKVRAGTSALILGSITLDQSADFIDSMQAIGCDAQCVLAGSAPPRVTISNMPAYNAPTESVFDAPF